MPSLAQKRSISIALSALMGEAGINASKLGGELDIPRATIANIASGRTPDPRISTLEAIANYFNVSVEELVGKQPLHSQQATSVVQSLVPIISLDQADHWQKTLGELQPNETVERVAIDTGSSGLKFAVKVKGDAMWPQFEDGAILIVDTEQPVKNRAFTVTHIKQTGEIVFRQLFEEGKTRVLKAINPVFPSIELTDDDKVIGVVTKQTTIYD